jgi:transposase
MKDNKVLTDYRGLSQEELKKLPLDELARIAHEALQNWDKLNQRVNQDSTNSNKAPSTDNPEARAKRKAETPPPTRKHGARKQGAQPGHKAASRPILPLEEGDEAVDCKPSVCAHCGESLEGQMDPAPYRQQHYDFEINRRTTEYRKHTFECPCCGKKTEGTLPPEANESAYGPNVVALIGVLTGFCQMSRRMAREFLQEVVGIPISVGSISNIEKELAETMSEVMEEIETVAHNAAHGNADETSFGMENGKTGWLWVLVTQYAVVFRLFVGRGQEWASKLLGKFGGILTSDRWCGYNLYPQEKHQLCWAHLARDFKAMCESGAYGEAIGKALRKEAKLMFRLWHRFKRWKSNQEKAGVQVSMTVLETQMHKIRARIKALLEKGAELGVPKCGPILKVEPLLWVFTEEDGVEPTNNEAERAIRSAVLWKKKSYGVESERGGQYVESVLSLWATSRRNGVNAVKFLRELVAASRTGGKAPSIFHSSHS